MKEQKKQNNYHGECLACACLTISKNTHIMSIHCRSQNWLHLTKYTFCKSSESKVNKYLPLSKTWNYNQIITIGKTHWGLNFILTLACFLRKSLIKLKIFPCSSNLNSKSLWSSWYGFKNSSLLCPIFQLI